MRKIPVNLELLLESILDGQDINNMPPGPAHAHAKEIEELITLTIDYLRSPAFPNAEINALMSMAWDIIHYKICETGISPVVPTASFAAMRSKSTGSTRAFILVPPNWARGMERNAAFVTGGMVLCGSQAVDFYNGRIDGSEKSATESRARARAFEAEYLLALCSRTDSKPVLNSYQQELLAEFPRGLKDAEYLRYTPLPVVPVLRTPLAMHVIP